MNKVDLINRTFGELTVVAKTDERYYDGSALYLCRCSCGKTIKTTSSRLKSGHVKSCGDSVHNIKNLSGHKFGKLAVISLNRLDDKGAFWNCKCDCGNNTVMSSKSLQSGSVVSCGCVKKERLKMGQDALKKTFVDGTSLSAISQNRKLNKNNKTGIRGVSWSSQKKKYHAQITFKRKLINLGFFDNIDDAANARRKAEKEYFGDYINKID